MSRRKAVHEQRTLRERGAAIAYVSAVERLRKLDAERQLDLYQSRAALRREWVDIQTAAALVLA